MEYEANILVTLGPRSIPRFLTEIRVPIFDARASPCKSEFTHPGAAAELSLRQFWPSPAGSESAFRRGRARKSPGFGQIFALLGRKQWRVSGVSCC
jgi:hypothetical protein